jgi:hypothetical protein
MLAMLQKCGAVDGKTSPATFRYSSVVTIEALEKLGVSKPVVTGVKTLNCDLSQMEGLKKASVNNLLVSILDKSLARRGLAWMAGWIMTVVDDDVQVEQQIVDQVAKEDAAALNSTNISTLAAKS